MNRMSPETYMFIIQNCNLRGVEVRTEEKERKAKKKRRKGREKKEKGNKKGERDENRGMEGQKKAVWSHFFLSMLYFLAIKSFGNCNIMLLTIN